MSDRLTGILSRTLIVGGLYFLATLVVGFLGVSYVGGMAMGEVTSGRQNGADFGQAALIFILGILQPIAVLIAWLGSKKPSIHEHIALGHLMLISCAWSFIMGLVYAMLTRGRHWDAHEQKA